ncbi:MAG TPA: hypothetical protein VMG31_16345 [Verrucomicrobiae bacterium]|nr:hypothetical protein [Verrucomicrobiae bacterium]
MQGDVRLVSDYPTVVPGFDVEEIAGLHLDHAAVVHGSRRAPGKSEPHVLDLATPRAGSFADMDTVSMRKKRPRLCAVAVLI